jgi:hypothetical protein
VKSLARKTYKFCQKLKVYPRIEIGFAKKKKFNQERIQVLLRKKNLTKKTCRFCQDIKVQPKKDSLTKKGYRFC